MIKKTKKKEKKTFLKGYQLDVVEKLKGRRTLRSDTIFGYWKPFKNDEECFLFHLKSSCRSQIAK